jgi:hypothetical protein
VALLGVHTHDRPERIHTMTPNANQPGRKIELVPIGPPSNIPHQGRVFDRYFAAAMQGLLAHEGNIRQLISGNGLETRSARDVSAAFHPEDEVLRNSPGASVAYRALEIAEAMLILRQRSFAGLRFITVPNPQPPDDDDLL